MQEIVQLYDDLATTSDRDFYRIEADFFMLLQRIPDGEKVDEVIAFLTISNWKGTSLRSGVWTYYESVQQKDLQVTTAYLNDNGHSELAEIFALGIHDYKNPIYAESFEYPSEWMDEADEIDHWIFTHEKWLEEWLRNLLLNSKAIVMAQFA